MPKQGVTLYFPAQRRGDLLTKLIFNGYNLRVNHALVPYGQAHVTIHGTGMPIGLQILD